MKIQVNTIKMGGFFMAMLVYRRVPFKLRGLLGGHVKSFLPKHVDASELRSLRAGQGLLLFFS